MSYYREPYPNAAPSHRVFDIVSHAHLEVLSPQATKGILLPDYHDVTIKRLVWKTLHFARDAVIFLLIATTITSFGLPCWYYYCYRLPPPRHGEEETSLTQQQLILAQWLSTLKRLRSQWKSFFALSVGVLPVILPMLSAYPIKKCSWPLLLSTVALLSGLTALIITSLYRWHLDALRCDSASRAWHEASVSGWDTSLAKGFGVLVSMPMIWLLYLMIALVASIIVIVWDQGSIDKLSSDLCLPWHTNVFRATLLTLVCTASAHLIFIILVLLFFFEK